MCYSRCFSLAKPQISTSSTIWSTVENALFVNKTDLHRRSYDDARSVETAKLSTNNQSDLAELISGDSDGVQFGPRPVTWTVTTLIANMPTTHGHSGNARPQRQRQCP
jgi:hypothetical protein